ncbi:MAG: hypothetical protein ABI992_11585, partial [Chthoniobacterales bacterium]
MRTSEISPGERIERFIAAALSVILVGVHFLVLLNRGPLWRDEISSLTLATQPTMSLFWAALA